jgi:hypothetical protein
VWYLQEIFLESSGFRIFNCIVLLQVTVPICRTIKNFITVQCCRLQEVLEYLYCCPAIYIRGALDHDSVSMGGWKTSLRKKVPNCQIFCLFLLNMGITLVRRTFQFLSALRQWDIHQLYFIKYYITFCVFTGNRKMDTHLCLFCVISVKVVHNLGIVGS